MTLRFVAFDSGRSQPSRRAPALDLLLGDVLEPASAEWRQSLAADHRTRVANRRPLSLTIVGQWIDSEGSQPEDCIFQRFLNAPARIQTWDISRPPSESPAGAPAAVPRTDGVRRPGGPSALASAML
jgi:hypothetical protein